jgi:hypothetical protein
MNFSKLGLVDRFGAFTDDSCPPFLEQNEEKIYWKNLHDPHNYHTSCTTRAELMMEDNEEVLIHTTNNI